ncbi:hypothetical protein C9374_011546 [Naegleria lovaniensis]|uniref:Uncharacterized protein n=1 Tax=Naegleria lovaniensis TaxID=51637 RepID=A0AA88H2Q4_NAELO|nr:uncharacterized protein C9374_011546 [Naegleria lovaniensis]KAG2392821.1 hypothetical protein C9374_011546 [Naegleria lovaniensis]
MQVVVQLMDLMSIPIWLRHEDHYHQDEFYLLKLLQQLLRKPKMRTRRAFSMNFEMTNVLGQDFSSIPENEKTYTLHGDLPLHYPCEVKISYTLSCLLISNYGGNCNGILILDLETKKVKTNIKTDKSPSYLFVEEQYNGHTDALIFVCDSTHTVSKFDLGSIMSPTLPVEVGVKSEHFIWQNSSILNPEGITGWNSQLFVCCSRSNTINVLSSKTGLPLYEISLPYSPYGIDFSVDAEYLIVSSDNEQSIVMLQRTISGTDIKWEYRYNNLDICTNLKGLDFAYALTVDKAANHIIVTDDLNTVSIFNNVGTLLKRFTSKYNIKIESPYGACVNELTGELIVCDNGESRVLIFK